MPRSVTTALAAAALVCAAVALLATGIFARLLGIAAAFILLWWWLAAGVFRPLLAMIREAEAARRRKESLEVAEISPRLAPLGEGIAALARQLETARGEAGPPAGGDETRRRLESILRDLSEGVLVCNLGHQILLYNRVAMRLLSEEGEVGIGTPPTWCSTPRR